MTAAPLLTPASPAPRPAGPSVPRPAVPAGTEPAATGPAETGFAATSPAATGPAEYTVSLAADEADVRAVQRLRHQVFAQELGATLHSPVPGLDIDGFDDFCDHLLVRERATGTVVGTYRMLRPAAALRAGRLYSEGEFELAALADLRPRMVEVGRSCVHPGHRDGAVIGLLWGGLLHYLQETGCDWIAGCCSLGLADGGGSAASVWDRVSDRNLSPEEFRVRPRTPWSPEGIARPSRGALPALLRGYLRLGAWVCGEPAYDPDFGVADLFVLLSLERTDPRYLRHFMALGASR
ncbi:GNAT family N-acetyltransferase [Streptacidiphilus griseoplanus]|uniref:GNAT family N-acetyltransferase n=1 Tax=Peterkaempfera griseoplana TaxID=66896 RepID=UPI0006E3E0E1|nr:GNAT family N-acetyltransferase [Peterkaempfera griseoplana]